MPIILLCFLICDFQSFLGFWRIWALLYFRFQNKLSHVYFIGNLTEHCTWLWSIFRERVWAWTIKMPDDLAWISLILPFTCVERFREVPRDSMHWLTGKPNVLYKQTGRTFFYQIRRFSILEPKSVEPGVQVHSICILPLLLSHAP